MIVLSVRSIPRRSSFILRKNDHKNINKSVNFLNCLRMLPLISLILCDNFYNLFDIFVYIVFHTANLNVNWAGMAEIKSKFSH